MPSERSSTPGLKGRKPTPAVERHRTRCGVTAAHSVIGYPPGRRWRRSRYSGASPARPLAGEPACRRPLRPADELRWERAGGNALAGRPARGVSLESRRAYGRLGHPGRDRAVPQPHTERRGEPRQPVGPHAWLLARRRPGHVLDARRHGRLERNPLSTSGVRRFLADLPGLTSKEWPSSTGLPMALAWCTARRGRGTRCPCVTPATEAKPIFSAPAGLHAHFPVWAPDQRSSISCKGPCPIAWTSGASHQPAEHRNASPITIHG